VTLPVTALIGALSEIERHYCYHFLTESTMELMEFGWPVLLVVVILAGALLFTPYEAVLEGVIALAMVTAVLVGFLMHPRRDVFYHGHP
jgi:hypothetical protein